MNTHTHTASANFSPSGRGAKYVGVHVRGGEIRSGYGIQCTIKYLIIILENPLGESHVSSPGVHRQLNEDILANQASLSNSLPRGCGAAPPQSIISLLAVWGCSNVVVGDHMWQLRFVATAVNLGRICPPPPPMPGSARG